MKAIHPLILVPVFCVFIYFSLYANINAFESSLLYYSQLMLSQLFPFRDFSYTLPPLPLYITALFSGFFGASYLMLRILLSLLGIGCTYLVFRTTHLATRNKLYALLASLVFISWAAPQFTLSPHLSFALFFVLLTFFFILKFAETRNLNYMFAAGLICFCTILSVYSIGIGICISLIAFMLIKSSRDIHVILRFLLGFFWGIIIFAVYLLMNDSFGYFLRDAITHKQPSLHMGTGSYLVDTLAFVVLVITIASLFLLIIRRRFHLLFLPLSLLLFFAVSASNPQYLISLSGISVALYIRYNISSSIRMILFLVAGGVIILGLLSNPIYPEKVFDNNSKIRIFVDQENKSKYDQISAIYRFLSEKNEYTIIDSNDPNLYFISNGRNPFRTTTRNHKSYHKEIVSELVAKEIKVIILKKNNYDSFLNDYLSKNYRLLKIIGEEYIYVRIS